MQVAVVVLVGFVMAIVFYQLAAGGGPPSDNPHGPGAGGSL